MSTDTERFVALFNKPTVEAISALTQRDFERFVAYTLRRAGYDVKEVGGRLLRGVDLEIREHGGSRIVAAVECKRFAPGQLVNAAMVKSALGTSAAQRSGTMPFIITTSDFNEAAYLAARANGSHVYLMNGAQLVRYINYVRQSRNNDDDIIASISPEYFTGKESVRPRRVTNTRVLAVANNKGGVGKTTTAYYLGVEIARRGKRTLLIDLDGQGNLTERCLPEQVARRTDEGQMFPNVTHYFTGERRLVDLVTPTEVERLSIIPADPYLTLRDYGGQGRPDVELGFVRDVQALCAKQLASLAGPPDWVIIDTPPSMSVFTRGGLSVAEYVVAPLRPRTSSLAGTRNMLQTLRTANALMGTDANFLGGVITHWDDLDLSNTALQFNIVPAISQFGGRVLQTKIPIDNRLENIQPGSGTNGARAYGALAEEVLRCAE